MKITRLTLPTRQHARFLELLVLATSVNITAGASSATGQTAAQSAVPATDADAPAEVIVTANRREESVQKVPIAISVISAEEVDAMSIADTNALSGKIPSLTVANSGSQQYFLRGVGTTGTGNNVEQSVATYVDGVYLYGNYTPPVPLGSIDRVEVLKGPQGTLFGRNTTAGVVQIVTRDPLAEPTIEGRLHYENYDTVNAGLYGSTRVTDRFGITLAADYRNQGDGYGYNTTRYVRADWNDHLSLQTKAVLKPADGSKLTAFFWFDHYSSDGLIQHIAPGFKGLDNVTRDLGFYQVVANTPTRLEYKSYLGYLRWDQDLGFGQFVSISAYRSVENFDRTDQDSVPVTVVDGILHQPAHNVSQEFQLLSPNDGKLTWLLGAYYFHGVAKYDPAQIDGLAEAAFGGQIEEYRAQTINSVAGFGQLTYEILSGTKLTAGLRDTHETEKLAPGITSSFGVPVATLPPFHGDEVDSSGRTWRVALNQELTRDSMGYLSYNRGLKSGGFSLVTATNLPAYHPERIDAYEVGVKSQWFDQRMRLNTALFYYNFTDIQVNQITTAGTAVSNAAAAAIKGLDMDFEANLTRHLALNGALGWLDGRYNNYPDAVGYRPRPTGGASAYIFDANGKTTVFTPRWSATLGANYRVPSQVGEFRVGGFVQYVGSQFTAPDNDLPMPSYTVVNASLAWQSVDEKFGVTLGAQNLTGRQYYSDVLESSIGFTVIPAAPRTYGVTFNAKL